MIKKIYFFFIFCEFVFIELDANEVGSSKKFLDYSIINTESNLQIEEVPYQASLIKNNNQFLCGAFIINPNTILTARHCLFDKQLDKYEDLNNLKIYVGSNNLSDFFNSQNGFEIKNYVYHTGQPMKYNDIALIFIKKSFSFQTDQIKPACLLKNLKSFKKLSISGFGLTKFGKISNIMRKASFSDISDYANDKFGCNYCLIKAKGFVPFSSCDGDYFNYFEFLF